MTYQLDGITAKCPGIDYIDECPGNPAGSVPKLSRENEQFLQFWGKVNPWIWNGMGGFVVGAITELMKTYGIRRSIRGALMDRCNIMVHAYLQVKDQEKPQGR